MSYRKLLGPSAMLLTLAAPVAAQAADAPYGTGMAPAVYSHNWAGFYAGGHIGGLWGDTSNDFEGDDRRADMDGFIGGAQMGYNFQNGNWVYGLEGDFSFSGADGNFGIGIEGEAEWIATLRGRIGYTTGSTLFYVTGGAAFGEGEITGLGTSDSQTHTGYVIGGGVEYAFSDSLSAKIEYNYISLGDEDYLGGTIPNADFDGSMLKLGINWHFNTGY